MLSFAHGLNSCSCFPFSIEMADQIPHGSCGTGEADGKHHEDLAAELKGLFGLGLDELLLVTVIVPVVWFPSLILLALDILVGSSFVEETMQHAWQSARSLGMRVHAFC